MPPDNPTFSGGDEDAIAAVVAVAAQQWPVAAAAVAAALCIFCAYRRRKILCSYRKNRFATRRPSAPRPPLANVNGPLKMPVQPRPKGAMCLDCAPTERASLGARMPSGGPPSSMEARISPRRPPRLVPKRECSTAEVRAALKSGSRSQQQIVVVMPETPPSVNDNDNTLAPGSDGSALASEIRRSQSVKPMTPKPEVERAKGSAQLQRARRSLSVNNAARNSCSGSMQQAKDGQLRRQQQVEKATKATEKATEKASLKTAAESDCVCVCSCDSGRSVGHGNCVCVCVCGAVDEEAEWLSPKRGGNVY